MEAYWSGFADAESDIAYYRVAVGRGVYNPRLNKTFVYPEYFFPFTAVGAVQSWRHETFNFLDGTNVFFSVQAVNQAGLGTVASSNGYIIDRYYILTLSVISIMPTQLLTEPQNTTSSPLYHGWTQRIWIAGTTSAIAGRERLQGLWSWTGHQVHVHQDIN